MPNLDWENRRKLNPDTYVIFSLGSSEFAVSVNVVKEILRLVELTALPELPLSVEGVINLRGEIIPIIDLKQRFLLGKVNQNIYTRIVVVKMQTLVAGLLVEGVSEVSRIPKEDISLPSKEALGIDLRYILGIGKVGERIVIILEPAQIFNQFELSEINKSYRELNPPQST
jgi:purine-binding chemotaxis protein CheW